MEASRAEGKRSFKYCNNMVEEEAEEEEDEASELGFGEDERKREMIPASSRRASPGSTGGSATITCQADNCNADFTEAKPYHRRHKVCEFHAKAPVVNVGGLHKRFCQQCSRKIFACEKDIDFQAQEAMLKSLRDCYYHCYAEEHQDFVLQRIASTMCLHFPGQIA